MLSTSNITIVRPRVIAILHIYIINYIILIALVRSGMRNTSCHRRRFIAGTSAILLGGMAGCTDDERSTGGGGDGFGGGDEQSDLDNDGVPDSCDDFPRDSTRSTLFDSRLETVDLNEDYYQAPPFTSPTTCNTRIQGRGDGDIRIDVILTDETNYQYFEDGPEWEYYAEGSDLDTLYATGEMELVNDRTYYLIIHNTTEGRAAPPSNFENDRVEVTVDYELYN